MLNSAITSTKLPPATPLARRPIAWKKIAIATLYYGVCTVLTLMFLFPIAWSILTSFETTAEAMASPPLYWPSRFSLENYRGLAAYGQGIKLYLWNSSSIAALTVFGTLMYVVEGPENGFTSIPVSIYWAIVTLTTVGYGDIVPQTVLGRIISAMVMITGYSIIAVPTGIFTAELANAMRGEQLEHDCPACKKQRHEQSASFCSRCGNALFTKNA